MCNLGRLDKKAHDMGMSAPKPGQIVRPDLSSDVPSGAVMAEAHIPSL